MTKLKSANRKSWSLFSRYLKVALLMSEKLEN